MLGDFEDCQQRLNYLGHLQPEEPRIDFFLGGDGTQVGELLAQLFFVCFLFVTLLK